MAHSFDAFLWIWIPYGKMGLTGLCAFMDMDSLRENGSHRVMRFYGYTFPAGNWSHRVMRFYGYRVLELALTSCNLICNYLIIKM